MIVARSFPSGGGLAVKAALTALAGVGQESPVIDSTVVTDLPLSSQIIEEANAGEANDDANDDANGDAILARSVPDPESLNLLENAPIMGPYHAWPGEDPMEMIYKIRPIANKDDRWSEGFGARFWTVRHRQDPRVVEVYGLPVGTPVAEVRKFFAEERAQEAVVRGLEEAFYAALAQSAGQMELEDAIREIYKGAEAATEALDRELHPLALRLTRQWLPWDAATEEKKSERQLKEELRQLVQAKQWICRKRDEDLAPFKAIANVRLDEAEERRLAYETAVQKHQAERDLRLDLLDSLYGSKSHEHKIMNDPHHHEAEPHDG